MTSKTFFKNLIFIGIFIVAVFLLVLFWLRMYTNHGQKLELPNFVEMDLKEASQKAEDETFQIIVNDSVHIIGKQGGIIMDQNPKAFSKVKENRKVYVTTTKYIADRITVSNLPSLYGREYERKKKELEYMDLNSRIKGYKYDEGEPNHILEVYYNGKLIISRDGRQNDVEIEKGGTLDFLLSEPTGGVTNIPNVTCLDYESAVFLIKSLKFKVGPVSDDGNISDASSAYVVSQSPAYSEDGKMQIGDVISLTLSQEKPENCE